MYIFLFKKLITFFKISKLNNFINLLNKINIILEFILNLNVSFNKIKTSI